MLTLKITIVIFMNVVGLQVPIIGRAMLLEQKGVNVVTIDAV